MRVIASGKGFYKGRRRVGDVFEMDESAMKKDSDGRPILPRWVEPVKGDDERARRFVAGLIGIDAMVAHRAAIATSVVRRKPQTFVAAMKREAAT